MRYGVKMEDTNLPQDEEFEHPYMDVTGPSHWENLAARANSLQSSENSTKPVVEKNKEQVPEPITTESSDNLATQANKVNTGKKPFKLNFFYPLGLVVLALIIFFVWGAQGSSAPLPTPTLPAISLT